MICGLFGVGVLRRVYFGFILGLVDPLRPAALLFLVEVCYVFVAGVWKVELLVAVVLVGCIGSVMGIRLMCVVLSTLSTLLLLLLYSFVDVSSLLRTYLRVSGTKVLLLLVGMLFYVTGRLYVVMVRVVVLSLPLSPGTGGFPQICMVSLGGSSIPLRC